jgi:hypothetical protein
MKKLMNEGVERRVWEASGVEVVEGRKRRGGEWSEGRYL